MKTGTVLLGCKSGIGATKKTWSATINPHLKKMDKSFGAIFSSFEKEKKAKGLTTILEENKLWVSKYQPKMDKLSKEIDAEYKKIYRKFHSK